MDINKVYIGYNTKLKRCLLFRKKNTYIDIETSQTYAKEQVLENTLISYNDLIQIQGFISKGKLKDGFHQDQEQLIRLNNVFVGDIFKVEEVKRTSYYGSSIINMDFKQDLDGTVLFNNRLLLKDDYSYTDLITNMKYHTDMVLSKGDYYIDESNNHLKKFNEIIKTQNEEQPKIKILSKYHEKYNIRQCY